MVGLGLKVLVVAPYFPPEANMFIYRFAKTISFFSEVKIIAVDSDSKGPSSFQGFDVFRLGGQKRSFESVVEVLDMLKEISWQPDIIHTHFFTVGPYWKLAARRVYGGWIPQIHTEHYSAFLLQNLTIKDKLLAALVMNSSDQVVAVSKPLAKAVEPYCLRKEVQVIGNVVDDVFFEKNSADNHRGGVLCVADYGSSVKGVSRLVQAWALLNKPDIPLSLAGNCPDVVRSEILQELEGFSVNFLGRLPPEELDIAYRSSRCLVIASEVETFSVVAAEALATGTPVVSTPCAGPETFLNSNSGVVAKDMSSEALAEALVAALDNEWNEDLIRKAAEPFQRDFIKQEYYSLYESVL